MSAESACNLPLDKYKLIAEGDNAFIYAPNDNIIWKIFKGTCHDYQYNEFLSEVEQTTMIAGLVKDKKLGDGNYLTMLSYADCCKSIGPKYPAFISYPRYEMSLQDLFVKSSSGDVEKIKKIMQQTLMSYIILYQVTGMIHGDFTHRNILLDKNNNPIIGGFGKMEKKPCKDHIKEFIWFIIPIRDYVSGDFDGVKRPWLAPLIQPSLVSELTGKFFLEIDGMLDKMSSKDIQTIYDHWIQ